MILEEELCRLSDEEVAVNAQNGDKDALNHIIARYRNFVYARANTYFLVGAEKDDVVQEGMIGLYKAVKEFNPDCSVSFKQFAGVCISRQIISAIKAATRKKHLPLNSYISLDSGTDDEKDEGMGVFIEDSDLNPELIVLHQEAAEGIERKINRLLSKMEMQVFGYYTEGRSYEEIAKLLEKPTKAVDNAIQRIKKKLLAELK